MTPQTLTLPTRETVYVRARAIFKLSMFLGCMGFALCVIKLMRLFRQRWLWAIGLSIIVAGVLR